MTKFEALKILKQPGTQALMGEHSRLFIKSLFDAPPEVRALLLAEHDDLKSEPASDIERRRAQTQSLKLQIKARQLRY